jgi:hypothetical protein
MDQNAKRLWAIRDSLLRITGFIREIKPDGSNLDQKDSPNVARWLSERDDLLPLAIELAQEGGSLRLLESSEGGMFSVHSGKPYVRVGQYSNMALVQHEMTHFRDWVRERNRLMSLGMTKRAAANLAALKMESANGTFNTEIRATETQFKFWIQHEPKMLTAVNIVGIMLYPRVSKLLVLLNEKTRSKNSWFLRLTTRPNNFRSFMETLETEIRTEVALIKLEFANHKSDVERRLTEALVKLGSSDPQLTERLKIDRDSLIDISLESLVLHSGGAENEQVANQVRSLFSP